MKTTDQAEFMHQLAKFNFLEQRFPKVEEFPADPVEVTPTEAHRSALLGLHQATKHLDDPEGVDWPELLDAMRVAELVLVAILQRDGEDRG